MNSANERYTVLVVHELKNLIDHLCANGVLRTPKIIEAFEKVDRKNFILDEYAQMAYDDNALPIGHGQTISQPYTVAFMLELLAPKVDENILDVGSGSGWTTALLAHIVGTEGRVWGTEIVPELVTFGSKNLKKYPYKHAEILQAKELGLKEHAPYDKILVSAASEVLPRELVGQLKIGGTMVMPIKTAVWKVVRKSKTRERVEKHEGFAFVSLI